MLPSPGELTNFEAAKLALLCLILFTLWLTSRNR